MIFTKTTGRTARLVLAATAISLAATGCTRIRDQQGYIVDQELVQAISPGVDNRESVTRTLGRPTFESKWDPNTWYYVSRNVQNVAFLPKETTGQSIMTVRFDAAGNVAAVDIQEGMEQVALFDPESDVTPVFGRDTSLFEEIFGNLGRVSSVPTGGGPQQ